MYRVGDPPPPVESAQGPTRSRRWLLWLVGSAAVVGFIAAVVGSASTSSVPTGGGMSGMSMSGTTGRVDLVARDIDGRHVAVPGGRPSAVVVIQSGDCAPCVRSIRRLSAAAARVPGVRLVALSVQADDDRQALRALAARSGATSLRFVVDGRNGMLVSMLGVSQMGTIVVCDAAGRRVPVRGDSVAGLRAALRRATA